MCWVLIYFVLLKSLVLCCMLSCGVFCSVGIFCGFFGCVDFGFCVVLWCVRFCSVDFLCVVFVVCSVLCCSLLLCSVRFCFLLHSVVSGTVRRGKIKRCSVVRSSLHYISLSLAHSLCTRLLLPVTSDTDNDDVIRSFECCVGGFRGVAAFSGEVGSLRSGGATSRPRNSRESQSESSNTSIAGLRANQNRENRLPPQA